MSTVQHASPASLPTDLDQVYREHFDAITRRFLRRLVTPELVEEHRKRPVGRHSEALGRLLAYFRRLPAARQYLLHQLPNGRYRIVRMATSRLAPPQAVAGQEFDTLEVAYHGVFLKKLDELMDDVNG